MTRLSLDGLAATLDGAARQGAGYSARCPAHDDAHASLSLSAGDDGRILLHCHAGCTFKDIVGAMGIEARDLMPERAQRPAAGKRAAWTAIQPVPRGVASPPTAHYKLGMYSRRWGYRDEDGELLGFVCRFDTPSGKEIRPLVFAAAADGRTGWRWQGFPTPRPLYGLDRLAQRPAASVLVCEGEKAADAAGELLPDAVATTSTSGAKSPHLANWAPVAGRPVWIWPDNDEPGTAFADEVARLTRKAGAASVHVLRLPPAGGEYPKGWDAADALAAGWSAERVNALRADPAFFVAPRSEREATVAEMRRVAGKRTASQQRQLESVLTDNFFAYLPAHRYLYRPTRELWPSASVNGGAYEWPKSIDGKPIAPSCWLDENQAVQQLTWWPSAEEVIHGRVVAAGGWIEHPGATVYNLYRPPMAIDGDPAKAGPWLEHCQTIYPDSAGHVAQWLAHRVQRPAEKLNHALVLGGPQGIGKDTLLEPVKAAVGPWNWAEISPAAMLGRFNGWAKSVVVRVSEARDLGDIDRFKFYDHSKAYVASPPDVLRVDEKNLREHSVPNALGMIITTNHLSDGIYLPDDDRRHYVAWSSSTKEMFSPEYWTWLWSWYADGGLGHVVAYLRTLDLAGFNSKAPPPKTAAWHQVVAAGGDPGDAELTDVVDTIAPPYGPATLTLDQVVLQARGQGAHDLAADLSDRKARRAIPHRLERIGYVAVRNPDAKDGLWKLGGKRQVVYARKTLAFADQLREARGRW